MNAVSAVVRLPQGLALTPRAGTRWPRRSGVDPAAVTQRGLTQWPLVNRYELTTTDPSRTPERELFGGGVADKI